MNEKSLILYYTHSGNTRRIAEIIKQQTGGDIIEIEPRKPYPVAYKETVEQAKKEISSNYMPELKTIVGDMSSYAKIFVGTPNWWSTIAPPIKTFLSQNDLSGKTIMPFCTHGGGGKGRIFEDIASECKNALVKEGLLIYSDGGTEAEQSVKQWLDV